MIDYPAVQRALHSADPEALPEALRAVLLTMAVTDVEVHLADYGLRVLIPLAGPADAVPLPLPDSVEGRVFAGQQPAVRRSGDGTALVTVPVTVRGDRQGTLTARLSADDAAGAGIEALRTVAQLLGHEIVVADRNTDRYQRGRRAVRLTLAAETQWQLLPGRSSRRREFALGAQLEPAYAIRGDGYDWAADGTSLELAVINGMGEGIAAALLTSLAVNALRNARRAGIGLADQAALADQAVFARHRGEEHVSALLMSFAYETGEVTVVDAGSPQLWRRRGRSIEQILLDPQLPLGMFEETAYTPHTFQVLSGDRLIIVSDGVHAARSPLGEVYSETALRRGITDSALLPAAEVPTAILREVSRHRLADADDDAVAVCLDWYGEAAAD